MKARGQVYNRPRGSGRMSMGQRAGPPARPGAAFVLLLVLASPIGRGADGFPGPSARRWWLAEPRDGYGRQP